MISIPNKCLTKIKKKKMATASNTNQEVKYNG
jgi:hypothetical protein